MECYLDNAATTRALPEVCELVAKVMYEDYGNPSSLHRKGWREKIMCGMPPDRLRKH